MDVVSVAKQSDDHAYSEGLCRSPEKYAENVIEISLWASGDSSDIFDYLLLFTNNQDTKHTKLDIKSVIDFHS